MEKEVKTSLWNEDSAVRFMADYEDFDGDLEKWKDSFYQVWRYQMTQRFAYSINLYERRDTGGYISLLVRKAYRKQTREMLETLWYRKVYEEDELVGTVPLYDIDDPDALDAYEVFTD